MRHWLKEKRLKKGLTQAKVAELSNISRSFYTHIEKGTKDPGVDNAKQIAKTLKFNWTIFFEDVCSLKEQSEVITIE